MPPAKKTVHPPRPYAPPASKPSLLSKFTLFFLGKREPEPAPQALPAPVNEYAAPNASFLSNVSSRSILTHALAPQTPPTPKDKFLQYLNAKGISELEAEGILSMAKKIDTEDEKSLLAQDSTFLAHTNTHQPVLAEFSTKSTNEIQTPEPKTRPKRALMFTQAHTDASDFVSRAASPLRLNVEQNSPQVNRSELANATGFETAREEMSETATTILDILGSKPELEKSEKKRKYEVCINPYTNPKLAKIKEMRLKTSPKSLGNKLLEKVEQTSTPTKRKNFFTSTPEKVETKEETKEAIKEEAKEAFKTPNDTRTKTSSAKNVVVPKIFDFKPKKSSLLKQEMSVRTEEKKEEEKSNKEEESKKEEESQQKLEDEKIESQTSKSGEDSLMKLDTNDSEKKDEEMALTQSPSPLVDSTFGRVFYFPEVLNQRFMESDVDLNKVEGFKRVFLF